MGKWSIVVAYDENRVIGNHGKLPWNIPSDLAYFKKITEGNVVVMGYNTWKGLPRRPLTNRLNVVIMDGRGGDLKDIEVVNSGGIGFEFEHCINILPVVTPIEHFMVIGGEKTYRRFLEETDLITTVYATHVHGTHPGDSYFPPLPSHNGWDIEATLYGPEYDRLIFTRK
jgi:dihydrofolate reductase